MGLDDTPPIEEPIEAVDEESEGPHRTIDPAFVYIVLVIMALIGLNNVPVDVRYTLVWTLLTVIAVVSIVVDRVAIEPPTLRNLLIGFGFGVLVGVPLLAVGIFQLKDISLKIFGKTSEALVFQTLVFTMPLAETLFFRGAMQAARSPIFTSITAGVWTMVLFFPQLDLAKYPLVAAVIGLCFLFANFLYSYLRHRFGLFAAWACQIAVNLLLLFAARLMG